MVNRQTHRASRLVQRLQELTSEVDTLQKRFNDLGRGLTRERVLVRQQNERQMEMSRQKQDRDSFYQFMEHERHTTQLRMKLV